MLEQLKNFIFCGFIVLVMPDLYGQEKKLVLPLGGNSWLTKGTGSEQVTNAGWMNWRQKDAVFSTFVYLTQPGLLSIKAKIDVPEGVSQLQCSVNGETVLTTVKGWGGSYVLGVFTVKDSGYLKIDLQGRSKTGAEFARLETFELSGTAVTEATGLVPNNEGNFYYWGRRGPSVHLNYDVSIIPEDIEWFYNEITVPEGYDPVGSYFMANGFAEGYFGIQVNSPTERRVLFSVWSPFQTDDPKQIPDNQKIILVKKGPGVTTGEFGNEGSGGQSFFRYNWKAGTSYKFLVRARPVADGYTNYTAYFYIPEHKTWKLIASFNRPATTTYLKRIHSFLENFDPLTGAITRKAVYHNQWVRTVGGNWKKITKATFTGDNTARKGYRLDYKGGLEEQGFFLQNGGFFNDRTPLFTGFSTTAPGQQPAVNLGSLD
ncbi:DUF3472 domain-containing protein [Flavihumibacter sp. CACIAM 22H1]|uniref:DUF3472 domain-containing protein n=1 Tax=Flavihumibacter sp. CACIAM 22H1 TaxID=1812911 RepID=UPI000A59BCAE|nr:DUF3472 domain-containing protein [Flavihumibacter sp. CACIAM 22H1]